MYADDLKSIVIDKKWDYEKYKKMKDNCKVSMSYLKKKVEEKYPNLIMIKVEMIYEYYMFSVKKNEDNGFFGFIEKDKLANYLVNYDSEIPVITIDTETKEKHKKTVTTLYANDEEKYKKRDKILKECSILLQMKNNIDNNDIVSFYPCINLICIDYYIKETNLLLVSVLGKINQSELDNLCIEILRDAELDMIDDLNRKITILNNIKNKITNNMFLDLEETNIVKKLIDEGINANKENTNILKYTLQNK